MRAMAPESKSNSSSSLSSAACKSRSKTMRVRSTLAANAIDKTAAAATAPRGPAQRWWRQAWRPTVRGGGKGAAAETTGRGQGGKEQQRQPQRTAATAAARDLVWRRPRAESSRPQPDGWRYKMRPNTKQNNAQEARDGAPVREGRTAVHVWHDWWLIV